MATDDRPIDRKADTETVEHTQSEDTKNDLRPDFDHFDTFRERAGGIRDRIPTLRIPSIPVVAVVMATLYAFVGVGALSVGYGATSLAAAYGGIHAGFIVGGVFTFAYGYVGVRVVDAVTESRP